MVDDLFQSVFCITDHALSYNSIILMSMIFSLYYFCLHIDLEANFPARVLYPPYPLSQNKKKMRPKIIFVLRSKHRCYLTMRKNNPEKFDMGMRKREHY